MRGSWLHPAAVDFRVCVNNRIISVEAAKRHAARGTGFVHGVSFKQPTLMLPVTNLKHTVENYAGPLNGIPTGTVRHDTSGSGRCAQSYFKKPSIAHDLKDGKRRTGKRRQTSKRGTWSTSRVLLPTEKSLGRTTLTASPSCYMPDWYSFHEPNSTPCISGMDTIRNCHD